MGFPIAKELALRPIANFTLGRVTSDLSIAERVIEGETGREIEFLRHGQLDAVGYGGSLMLDYEHYREMYEIDVEVRLTDVYLQSFGGTSEAVQGSAWRRAWECGADGGPPPASVAGPPGPVRPGVRLHALFRAGRGHAGLQ